MKGSFAFHLRNGLRDFLRAPMRLGRKRVAFGWFAGTVMLLLGLGLMFSGSPLTGSLGYETTAIIALTMAFLFPWNTVHRLADLKAEAIRHPLNDDRWELVAGGHATGWGTGMLLMILIPGLLLLSGAGLAMLFPKAMFVRNCDLGSGILWFLGIPCITGFWLVGLPALVMSGIRNPKVGAWICFGYVIGSLLLVGTKWMIGARVAFFNPILGSVVLPTYNPIVAQDWPFWASRILVLCWWVIGWTIFLLSYDPHHKKFTLARAFKPTGDVGWRIARTVHISLAAIAIFVTFLLRGSMGLDTPAGYLRTVLPAVKSTAHFSIFYDPESVVAKTIDEMALLHEFHYEYIAREFQLKDPVHIKVYLYPDATTKEHLTGARGSVFAKPWINTTHVYASGAEVSALRHELVHIMGREFGPAPTYVNMLAGIAEGTAEAVAWDSGPDLTFHQWAKGAGEVKDANGYPLRPPLERVMTQGGFFTGRIPLSYATAGSFMRWLMETYGLDKFKELFQTYSPWIPNAQWQWGAVYGKSLSELAAEWEQYLETEVPLDDRGRAIVRFSYEQPAFINQVCARVVAGHQAKAQTAFSLGLYDTAISEYQLLWEFQPGNLYHLFGKFAALADAQRYPEALAVSLEMLNHENLNLGLKARLHQERGDMFLRMAEWEQARAELELVLEHGSFGTMERDARIKLAMLELPAAPRRALIRGLTGEQTNALYHFATAQVALGTDDWIVPYLVARRFSMVGDFASSMPLHAAFLETPAAQEWIRRIESLPPPASAPAVPLPEAVVREMLLTAIYDAAHGHDVESAFALEALITRSQELELLDWTPADWHRFEDAAAYAVFLREERVEQPAWSTAKRIGEALTPSMEIPAMPDPAAPLSLSPALPTEASTVAPTDPAPDGSDTAVPPAPR